jgi:hypothetical protein
MTLRCSVVHVRALLLPMLALGLGLPLSACAVTIDDDPAVEATSETEQSLLVSNWTAPALVSTTTIWYPQVATLSGTTYMVHSGPGNQLSWRQLVGTIWTEPQAVGQTTTQRVSLAAFNGFLYMVRSDASQGTKLWVSKFSPSTGWSSSFQIAHTSFAGPPALAAFQGKLHMIGVDPASKKLWQATMSTAEVFTSAAIMEGHYSASRVSATVASCKLYIAHRASSGTTVVYNSFDGTSWGWDQSIPAGPGGAEIQAAEPVIAERAGYIHLLHRNTSTLFTDSQVWWTYFDGASWASEVTLPGASTYYGPSLIAGGTGLVAIQTVLGNSRASSLQFYQPLPIRFPTQCLVIQPPIFTL